MPTNRPAPGACPWAGSGVSCAPQGSAQLRWGKAVLVLGAGREPGPEAAAAQLIPALAGLRPPRHILSLAAPGQPQAWRVTDPRPPHSSLSCRLGHRDGTEHPPGTGWGKGEPQNAAERGRRIGVSLQSCGLRWGGGSQQPRGGISGFQSPGILGLKGKTDRLEEQSRGWGWFPCPSQGAGSDGWSGQHFPAHGAKSYK